MCVTPSGHLKFVTYTLHAAVRFSVSYKPKFILMWQSRKIIAQLTACACLFQGDSGGPLVANGKLVGIVSWRADPCGSGVPDVYTKIAAVRGWISGISGV
jgi:hypothetical protein